jgi:hypothetical protein
VAKNLQSEGLVEDDDIVLFTASFRTVERHSSNLIEIHKIREILQLLE